MIKALVERDGGPVGLKSLAGAAGVDTRDVENIIQPRLVDLGFLDVTARGRVLTPKGMREYGIFDFFSSQDKVDHIGPDES